MDFFVYLLLISIISNTYSQSSEYNHKKSLFLVHVVFRHGNRTAQPSELYPFDPYLNLTYFPIGNGQLTNEGKRKEFSIGTALRERYNAFLGDLYYPEIIDSWTTDYNRTKMSLKLVLASLFPPKREQIWYRDLNWQPVPVPYNYLKQSEDKVLLGTLCPFYKILYQQNQFSVKQQQKFQQYQTEFDYISGYSGLNVTSFLPVYNLFFGLSTEEECGLKLPQWTEKVWPDVIRKLAIQEYFAATATTQLKQMASGYFLKKIIKDTKAKIQNLSNKRKMYLYSAHENNLAELLITLNVFDKPHIPNYGSYITFEIHNVTNVYGIKIYYENYSTKRLQLLKLPGCDPLCPLDKFESLVAKYIPKNKLCFQN